MSGFAPSGASEQAAAARAAVELEDTVMPAVAPMTDIRPFPLADLPPDPDDAMRADVYGLLAALLSEPPSATLLERLAAMPERGDREDTRIAVAWRDLGRAARGIGVQAASKEYHALFIGVTEGELVPYASWYRTGSLMERPLVRLRSDLARLGFARREGVCEPEDHAAALCEVMGLLIVRAGDVDGAARARGFFETHVAPWMPAFFRDLEQAASAVLYRAVGALGAEFLDLESRFLSVDAEPLEAVTWHVAERQDQRQR